MGTIQFPLQRWRLHLHPITITPCRQHDHDTERPSRARKPMELDRQRMVNRNHVAPYDKSGQWLGKWCLTLVVRNSPRNISAQYKANNSLLWTRCECGRGSLWMACRHSRCLDLRVGYRRLGLG